MRGMHKQKKHKRKKRSIKKNKGSGLGTHVMIYRKGTRLSTIGYESQMAKPINKEVA